MARSFQELTRDRTEVDERLISMRDEIAVLARARDDGDADAGHIERLARLETGVARAVERRATLADEARAALADMATPDRLESTSQPDREARRDDGRGSSEHRSAALRAVELARIDARSADRLDAVIRDETDRHGVGARYLAAVASPDYASAFRHLIAEGQMAHLSMSPRELEAVRSVRQAMEARAMALGTGAGADGGFAVPFTLDPSIVLTSDGVVDPIRALARIVTIGTSVWEGVSSEGITSGYGYDDEAEEVGDSSPILAQPTATVEKAQAFIPFSVELGMDWGGLTSDLYRLLEDAKVVLEAEKFLNGQGHAFFEPSGLISTMDGGSKVNSGIANTFGVADAYALVEALPPRYQPRARFAANLSMMLRARRLTSPADLTNFPIINETLDRMLGKPIAEVSTMSSSALTGDEPLIFGDFKGFVIVDRVGMSVELVPHLFGMSRRPTGQRGLYAFWRNSSVIVNPNAFRLLHVKA